MHVAERPDIRGLNHPESPREAFGRLMRECDFDGDGRITSQDEALALKQQRPFAFELKLGMDQTLVFVGAERIAHVASVLGAEILAGRSDSARLPIERLMQSRTQMLTELVEAGWDGLLHSMDSYEELIPSLDASWVPSPDGLWRLYVPEADTVARVTLEALASASGRFVVVPVAPNPGSAQWAQYNAFPGMAYLPRPYVVPGGLFREMYGWDSYFIGRGAILTGRTDIARNLLENFIYAISHYGKIPNSNRSYHLSRTQPPFITSLSLAVFAKNGDRDLLERGARAAQTELDDVFLGESRRTPSGLSRYRDDASDIAAAEVTANPERFTAYHDHGSSTDAVVDDRAQRESGWDKSLRWGARAHKLEPVDLNSLLYLAEVNLAKMCTVLDGESSERARVFEERANVRKARMQRFWDAERGLFFDYDFEREQRTGYESAATFYPLFAGWATQDQAAAVAAAVPRFLEKGGLVTSTEASRKAAGNEELQWDWPGGWAPLQVIAVEGLRRYGFHAEANAIAYRWLWMIAGSAGREDGLIREKYDVVNASSEVQAAEYGNQGGGRGGYLRSRREWSFGFAWTNASVVDLLATLPADLRLALDRNVHPDVATSLLAHAVTTPDATKGGVARASPQSGIRADWL